MHSPLPSAAKGTSRELVAYQNNEAYLSALREHAPFGAVYERYSLWSTAGMAYAAEAGIPGILEVNAPLIEEQAQHRDLANRDLAESVARRAFAEATSIVAVSNGVASYLNDYAAAVGKVGVYICYDRHFPEGWRALGLNGAEIVFNPSATSRGLSAYLWKLEQTASAVANMYFVGAINRVGVEDLGDNDFYGTSYFADPRGQFVDGTASDTEAELVVRDLDLDLIEEVRNGWAFYRDRRPDAYGSLVEG